MSFQKTDLEVLDDNSISDHCKQAEIEKQHQIKYLECKSKYEEA